MKKIFIIVFFTINYSLLLAQIPLTIEGTVINNTDPGVWFGVVIPRNEPTSFKYLNNSISSVNFNGYMLQAGDENVASTNNHLDGEIITGNKLTWNGTDANGFTHGLFTGYNINVVVKYNYLDKTPLGLGRKSNGMTNTSGGVAYNIVIDPIVAFGAKGINNVNIYNNTIYSTKTVSQSTGRGLIDIYNNTDNGINAPSTGTKVFNNIFYTKYPIYNIRILDPDCLSGFESDYNIFWCEAGEPLFYITGNVKTFAQWQALGYDTHSVVINPSFIDFTDFVPNVRLDYGTNLGDTWKAGLSVNAVWGTTDPALTDQNGTWQVGARIYAFIPVTGITVTGAGGSSNINADNGTLQLSAEVLPVNAIDKTVTWSLVNGTGQATINATGFVTAVDNGTVTAIATANDGSGIYGTLVITNSNQIVPVTGITVTGAGGATAITTDNGTLQLSIAALPANATDKSVTWSLVNGTGQATISSTGLVTAVDNGTVTVRATANDGSRIFGTLVITNSNQIVPVTGITLTGAGGATTITTENGTLQLSAEVVPANATDKTVTWSLVNGTGQSTISANGLVTAVDNGTVTARATASDGSGIYGTLVITNSNQIVPVTGITVTGAGGANIITIYNGTLQLSAAVLPANATDKTVTWSLINGTGQATISTTGLVTAVANGTVTARATANDGSGIYGTFIITNSNLSVPVTGITITGAGGATTITTDNGTLQLSAAVLPANATNSTISWSLVNGTGQALINSSGLVTAVANGTVTVIATANDGSGIFGNLVITNSNQIVPVTGINVTGAEGATSIATDNGTLQLIAAVFPVNATDKTVTWSLINVTGQATISATGIVTAVANGTVRARATANDGSGVYGTLVITNSNQIVPVSSITITVITDKGLAGGANIITDNGTLQLSAEVLPANATVKTVTWSILNDTGQASISASGLVTAFDNGIVSAIAIANDNSGVSGTLEINISNQIVTPTGVTTTKEKRDPLKIIMTRYELKILLNDDYISWKAGIYNLQGNLVLSKLVESEVLTFDISSLSSGIYIIVLSDGENKRSVKVIKP